MKLNIQVDIDKFDDMADMDLETLIINSAAQQLIKEVMNNRYDHYGKTFKDLLEDKVKLLLIELMGDDFKKEVKEKVSENLTNRFVKSMQYKELKDRFGIDSDAIIKSGLKDLVADMVSTELKKRFK
jgi:translation initiation factor 2 alpha subunit (eIF-2alpha)